MIKRGEEYELWSPSCKFIYSQCYSFFSLPSTQYSILYMMSGCHGGCSPHSWWPSTRSWVPGNRWQCGSELLPWRATACVGLCLRRSSCCCEQKTVSVACSTVCQCSRLGLLCSAFSQMLGQRGSPRLEWGNMVQCQFVHHDSQVKWPEFNPRFHSEKPLSNCMNSATTWDSLPLFVIGHNDLTKF